MLRPPPPRRFPAYPAFAALLAVTLLGGCTGTISMGGGAVPPPGGSAGGPGNGGPGGPGPGTGNGTGTGNGGGGGPTGPMLDCTSPHAAVVRSQQLSSAQYTNTVQDLLHATGDPGSALGDRVFDAPDDTGVADRANAAAAVAQEAATNLAKWSPCTPPATGDATTCENQIIAKIGKQAYRRPLTTDEIGQMKTLFDAGIKTKDFATGVNWFLTGLLQSPDFLYQLVRPTATEVPGQVQPLGPYEYAARLSFFIWNSTPDDALMTAAGNGDFADATKSQAQLDRMISDSRFTRGINAFYGRWLNLAAFAEIARDDAGFDLTLAQSLPTSLLMSATQLYASPAPNIAGLFSGQTYYLNDTLRAFYGVAGTGTGFSAATMTGQSRRGILTHPAMMALLSRPAESNPIARGLFIFRNLLCGEIAPPAGFVIPPLPPIQPGLSTRDRLEEHVSNAVCAGCHKIFDPPGFALESFDQVGRYRTMDQGKAVDTSGTMAIGKDVDGVFATGDDFLTRIAASNDVRGCFAQQYLKFALTRTEMAPEDACSVAALGGAFAPSGDLKQLVAMVAKSDAFRLRATEGAGK